MGKKGPNFMTNPQDTIQGTNESLFRAFHIRVVLNLASPHFLISLLHLLNSRYVYRCGLQQEAQNDIDNNFLP